MGLTTAIVSAVAACVASCVAAAAAIYSAARQAKHHRTQSDRDHGFRQLYELYGPLMMLRQQANELRSRIGPPGQDLTDPDAWRLVNHIEEISEDPESSNYRIMEMLIEINRRSKIILYEKAGLSIEFPPPPSFRVFLAHVDLLEQSWNAHKNEEETVQTPFPREFDRDIERAVRTLRNQLWR
jgi:hypothetical protein